MEANTSEGVAKRGKYRHIAYCFLPLVTFVMLGVGLYMGGLWLALPIVFFMGAIPLLDLVTGWQDTVRFERSDFSPVELFFLHWNTRLYALFYMASVIYIVASIERFSGLEIGLLVGSLGLIGGIGFGSAHELLHGKEKIDYFIQRICTSFLFYPHYRLIHIRSHHLHAGTDHDENTAWLNESIYSYIVRTIPGSMIRSWKLEVRRAAGKLSTWQGFLRNQMTIYAVGQIALLAFLLWLGGLMGLLFYVAHIVVAHVVLESVNYIQHYGLMRQKHEGEYEKTGAEHSWDTYHFFSSYVTFRVGHHSYHHIAVQPYYLLETEAEAPKLPMGYFWAIPIVFLPPVWRRMINPKLGAAV